jgi:hypothetical protein
MKEKTEDGRRKMEDVRSGLWSFISGLLSLLDLNPGDDLGHPSSQKDPSHPEGEEVDADSVNETEGGDENGIEHLTKGHGQHHCH